MVERSEGPDRWTGPAESCIISLSLRRSSPTDTEHSVPQAEPEPSQLSMGSAAALRSIPPDDLTSTTAGRLGKGPLVAVPERDRPSP